MNRLENIAQSYTQAPWRRQLQLIGLFSLFLTIAALVARVYLSVSAKAALTGRDIQAKQAQIETVERDIEDRASRLAAILSSDAMEERARKMDFEPIAAEQIVYLKIPGYAGYSSVILAPDSPPQVVGAEVIPYEYTESVFAWMKRKLSGNMYRLVGGTP
jgi:cell division protein FtsL